MRVPRYTRTAQLLHWSIAAAIATAAAIALGFDGMPLSPHKIRLINYHKWAGLTVLWLLSVRILWRATHRPPLPPASLAAWQRTAAATVHWTLYVLMAATPMLGWVLSSAKGFPLRYLGVIPLPDLVPKDRAIAEFVQPIHLASAWTLLALAGMHAAAALKHHFVDHDDILRRMI